MHFKPNMEKGDFKKLMKEIEKAELAKCYIENIMEGDLAELSDQCDFSSENVTSQLTKLLQEIEAVRQNCIGYLQSKQSTCNAIGKVLSALSFLGGAVFWCSIRLPLVPALVVGAVGAVVHLGAEKGLEIVHNEGEKINRKIYDVQSTMFKLEEAPKHEIISWKYLITKFKELATLLREGVVKVREEDIYDINSLFKDAKKSLNNFRQHVDEFALDVKRVIDEQC
ncbi:uncharacterized protein [Ptychodera flava]|uniref:uncharacterized protein n=1 Tax=Ptychodera flava TaxID=63121 RepID=UPI00396A425A